ncbi:fructoselysine kinase [Candidatus Bathyarchaeota archaeon]|nr:fructoselysine kinase [Candidatus Bathyarchaeota archaeon]
MKYPEATPKPMVSVVGVGDNTVDRYMHLGLMFPGGNAVNVPALAARYGHTASYIGWLGSDPHGTLLLSSLREEGVDTSRCRVVDAANAYCEVGQMDGDRVFLRSSPGVRDRIKLNDEDLRFISEHDVAHSSVYSYLENQIEELSAAAQILSFDFSQGWTDKYLERVLPHVDIAFLSNPETSMGDAEAFMRRVHDCGPDLVVLTRGDRGALVYDGSDLYSQAVVETHVVDTLGAGDAFAARFLVERLSGKTVPAAMRLAAESAAETCGYYGAWGHGAPLWEHGNKAE